MICRSKACQHQLIGKTAVQLSDLHIGDRVNDSYLLAQFDFVRSLDPEFVFFTGDYLDNSSDWHLKKGQELLQQFPRGSIGNACVLGNHDHGSEYGESTCQSTAKSRNAWLRTFNDAGLNLLRDEAIDLGGLKDRWFERFVVWRF